MTIARMTANAFFERKCSFLLEGEKPKFALSYLDNVVPLCACIRFLNTSMFNQALCSKADWGSGKLEHDKRNVLVEYRGRDNFFKDKSASHITRLFCI